MTLATGQNSDLIIKNHVHACTLRKIYTLSDKLAEAERVKKYSPTRFLH